MDGNKSVPSMAVQIPTYNKMQFEDMGKPFMGKGVRSEEINIVNVNLCNEDPHLYIGRGDISGFRFPQIAVRGTRKIPTSSADTLCGPSICLSGAGINDTGYTYDRMNYNWYFGDNVGIDFNPIKEGSKMRDRFINSIKNIDMLYLSIDGYKEHYERDRAPAKWDRLLKFLEDFKTINRYDCECVVNYVVNAYNVHDISLEIEEVW